MRTSILQASDLSLDPIHQLLNDFLLLSLTVVIVKFFLCVIDLAPSYLDLLLDVVQIADLSLDIFCSLLDYLSLSLDEEVG